MRVELTRRSDKSTERFEILLGGTIHIISLEDAKKLADWIYELHPDSQYFETKPEDLDQAHGRVLGALKDLVTLAHSRNEALKKKIEADYYYGPIPGFIKIETTRMKAIKAWREYAAELETLKGNPCSICGTQPALLVDASEKATYWMCASCMFETIKDNMKLRLLVRKVEGVRKADNPDVTLTTDLNIAFAELSKAYLDLPAHLRGEGELLRVRIKSDCWRCGVTFQINKEPGIIDYTCPDCGLDNKEMNK